jgi:hypothetical protein
MVLFCSPAIRADRWLHDSPSAHPAPGPLDDKSIEPAHARRSLLRVPSTPLPVGSLASSPGPGSTAGAINGRRDGAGRNAPHCSDEDSSMSTAGWSKVRLERMRRILSGHLEREEMPGLVALVRHCDRVHVATLGTLAFDNPAPMRPDTHLPHRLAEQARNSRCGHDTGGRMQAEARRRD